METITQKYIEKARENLGKRLNKKLNDSNLREILGIKKSVMSLYTRGERECEDVDILFEIAHYAEVPPMEIVGRINAKKAKSEKTREYWKSLVKSSVASVGAVTIAGSLMTVTPGVAKAESNDLSTLHSIYYTNLVNVLKQVIGLIHASCFVCAGNFARYMSMNNNVKAFI